MKYKIVKNERGVYIVKKQTKRGWEGYAWFTNPKSALKEYCELQKKIKQPCFYCKKELKPFTIEFYKKRMFCFCKRCNKHAKDSIKSLELLSSV